MRKLVSLILLILVTVPVLSACASNADAPAQAVEDYLNAVVSKDEARLTTLVCADWESEALLELDSFQAVTASLDGVACTQTGTDGNTALVGCSGKIIASYNGENQEFNLEGRTYEVTQEGDTWLVCGTR